MKDFLGKEVNIGDEVVVIGYNRGLHLGNITHVTNKTAQVKSTYFEVKRESQQIFKIENKQAILDKIYQWLDENAFEYVKTVTFGINDIYKGFDSEKMIADIKKAMEE